MLFLSLHAWRLSPDIVFKSFWTSLLNFRTDTLDLLLLSILRFAILFLLARIAIHTAKSGPKAKKEEEAHPEKENNLAKGKEQEGESGGGAKPVNGVASAEGLLEPLLPKTKVGPW